MGGTNFSDGGIRNGGTADDYFTNDAGNVIFVRTSTANIPSAKAGFAVGCQLVASDTGITYNNTGTTSSCTFTQASLLRTGNKGYYAVEVGTNGTTNANVFGTTNGFAGTITGAYLIANDGTAATITITNAGVTLASIAKGTSAGAMVGATSLTSPTFVSTGTMVVVSSVNNVGGQAQVFLTFTVT